MAKLTQGTQIYFIDPADDSIVVIECATGFSPGGDPTDPIEDTCLEADERTYKRGLRTPGTATLNLNADPENSSHVRMYDLSRDSTVEEMNWVIGWSDGTDPPSGVDTSGEFVLPDTRTWFKFSGYISDFPFDFQLNTVVATAMTIQRSGASNWIQKSSS